MRITVISCVFTPEPLVSGLMSRELSIHLTQQGFRVTVLCPQPSRPLSADYSLSIDDANPATTWEDNFEIVRLPSFTAPQSGSLGRAKESFSFGRQACLYMKKQKESPDVLYVNAWPLLGQALIARYAQRNSIPMVLQIMDVYPESLLIKMPLVLRKIAAPPLRKLDRWTARKADKIVVISENMRQTYVHHREVPQDKVMTINIWQDESLFETLPSRQEGCSYYSVPDKRFTFLYLGNIGPVAGVDFLIRTFHHAAIENTQLVIVGDGSVKSRLVEMVKRLQIDHVRFISDPDPKNVPLIQSMAHVCLLPMKRMAGMSSIPSKLAAYMFSARPVLASVDKDSDTAHAIKNADCGWVVDPEKEETMAAKMRRIAVLPSYELERLGQNGRNYGLLHFAKSNNVPALGEIVLTACYR